ncbi:hypothetical protein, partial [Escherichia coli]|uniref:hypothetical protein n=1 Tax=Escherichia coli TaxID=562 RepID=UPI00200AC0D3
MDAVAALPFAADACLVASSFEADADDADDAAELADDAAAVFEDSALVSDAFAFVSDVFAAEADLAAARGYEHLLTVSEYVDNTIYRKKSPGLLDTVNSG